MNIQNQKQKVRLSRSLCRRRSLIKTKQQQNKYNIQSIQMDNEENFKINKNILTRLQKPLNYNEIPKTFRQQQHKYIKNSMYFGDSQFNFQQTNYSDRIKYENKVLNTQPPYHKQQIKFLKISRKLKKRNQKVLNEIQQLILDSTVQYENKKQIVNNSSIQKIDEDELIKCMNNTINNKPQEIQQQSDIFKLTFQEQSKQKVQNQQSGTITQIKSIVQFSNLFQDEIISIKNSVYSTIPKGKIIKCYIKKIKTFNISLQMYLQDTHFLMKSELQKGSIGSNHYISVSKEINKKSISYLGKLRSDFMNLSYSLYDDGISQKQNKQIQSQRRMCLANIQHQNNVLSPRKIKIVIPNPRFHNREIYKIGDKQSLSSINTIHPYSTITLKNRINKWDEQNRRYFLDFKNSSIEHSNKNFIIQNNQGQQILLFGKINKDTFSLVFQYPLSVYQAFGIALSSLEAAVRS